MNSNKGLCRSWVRCFGPFRVWRFTEASPGEFLGKEPEMELPAIVGDLRNAA